MKKGILFGSILLLANGLHAQSPTYTWAKRLGGSNTDQAYAAAVDTAGAVLTAGVFFGTSDFNPGAATFPLTSTTAGNVFISKLTAAGAFAWAARLGGTGGVECGGIATATSGSVYTVGNFTNSIDLDPSATAALNVSSTGFDDGFVSKLDGAGNFVWARTLAGTGVDIPKAVAVDAATGAVYVAGFFDGTTDFDPGPGTFTLSAPAGRYECFVLKFDSAGNFVWADRFGGTQNDWAYGLAIDSAGSVLVTGKFRDVADFDPGPGSFPVSAATADGDGYVLKLSPATGALVWVRRFGNLESPEALGIATGAAGAVYFTGAFGGTTDFDPGPGIANRTALTGNDIYVCKLDSAGAYQWASAFPGTDYYDDGKSIAVDKAGGVYVTGIFGGTVDFDPGPGTFNQVATNLDGYLMKLSATTGALVWARGVGGSGNDISSAVRVASPNTVHAVGRFSSTANFAPGMPYQFLSSTGGDDAFVMTWDGGTICDTLATLTLSAITGSTATLMWTPVAGGASGYEWAVTTSAAAPTVFTATTATTATATGLLPATTYWAHVRSVCGTSSSGWKRLPFTTAAATAVEATPAGAHHLQVSPNPASDVLTIECASPQRLTLWDVTGRAVASLQAVPGVQRLSVARLPAGVYVLRSAAGAHTVCVVKR